MPYYPSTRLYGESSQEFIGRGKLRGEEMAGNIFRGNSLKLRLG
jgi:hypothetical protein